MPVRPARYGDLPTVAAIYAAAFRNDALSIALMPHQDEYPTDTLRAWRHRLTENWWDYTKTSVVSYEDIDGTEVLTGIVEWTREGNGWEKLWSIKGQWDPRLLILPLLKAYHRLHRAVFGNRASVHPTPTDPNPYTYWTWHAAISPFISKHLIPPSSWAEQKTIESSSESDSSSTTTVSPRPTSNQPFWDLTILSVDPRYHGLGHGRALVAWGMNLAREQNLPALVIALEGKERFYRLCGFTNLVGWATEGDGNPLVRMGVRGGAILWSEPLWKEEKCDANVNKDEVRK